MPATSLVRSPKYLLISFTCILALSTPVSLGYQWHLSSSQDKTKGKWQVAQDYAREKGVEIDINAYIDSKKGNGVALIDGHPWLKEVFSNTDHVSSGLTELPALPNGVPILDRDHNKNILLIRERLTIPTKEKLSDREVIERLQEALTPCNQDLDRLKQAIMESSDLGTESLKAAKGSVNYHFRVKLMHDLLLTKAYCTLMLGGNDCSDFQAACKLRELYSNHGVGSLLETTVNIAIKLRTESTANAYAYSPQAKTNTVKQLVAILPSKPNHLNFKLIIRSELAAVSVIWADMHEDVKKGRNPLYPDSSPMPEHVFLEIRSDFIRFYIDYLIKPDETAVDIQPSDLEPIAGDLDPRVRNLKPHSRQMITDIMDGMDKHYHIYLKSDMQLGLKRLALASRLYQLENGQYPKTLSQITPKYLTKLPTIPHTGTPFSYHPPASPSSLPNFTGSLTFGSKRIEVDWLHPVKD
ncbi:hypothetical protein SAMN02745181_2739 [Rubritalea squalenifaciens DSM 18772]|uniref:Uncharacterized protein n=1 Tax=Rubritalea squalenifaciens DSM 18772 TaxID=1123071 RepID=A0A1M6MIC2_9BACT|nr:hypothetical protein [Rubritalea squalenifaciens]SHJ83070.1 hypothetical protein SAMN02745181_2739 [Rubritalea squalenifaciens DSM 18772]